MGFCEVSEVSEVSGIGVTGVGVAGFLSSAGRKSSLPRESWWTALVVAVRKLSEVGPRVAKIPCAVRVKINDKIITGIVKREEPNFEFLVVRV